MKKFLGIVKLQEQGINVGSLLKRRLHPPWIALCVAGIETMLTATPGNLAESAAERRGLPPELV